MQLLESLRNQLIEPISCIVICIDYYKIVEPIQNKLWKTNIGNNLYEILMCKY